MRIQNRTRNTLLGSRVKVASTWWGRLRGYIARPRPKQGEGILLVRCDAIHMHWMTFPLDVVFLDEKGRVLKVVPSLRPWRRTRRVRESQYVLEVPVGTIDASGTQVGDELTWREPAPYTISVLSTSRNDEGPSSMASGGTGG